MRVRPSFLVALCLAVAGGGLALVLQGGKSRYERFQAADAAARKAQEAQWAAGRPYLPETIASLDLLKLHAQAQRLTTGCQTGYVRCYVVSKPPNVVAPEFPGLLMSIGANLHPVLAGDRAYEQAARAEGLKPAPSLNVNECSTSPFYTWAVRCQYTAMVDRNEIGALLGPYLRCDPSCAHARFTGETEILITIPGASPPTTP